MFASVDVEKKVGKGALEAGAPPFVNGETRSGNFRGGGKIENAGAFRNLPVGFGSEIEFGSRAPAANFDVVFSAVSDGDAGVRDIGDGEQQFALGGVQLGDALVGLLDEFRDLFLFREDGVGALLLLFGAW